MTRAHAKIGTIRYAVQIDANGHAITADEPSSNGGANAGPAPYDLLLASLAACTAITLRMYADRKQWSVSSIAVDLRYSRHDGQEQIDRVLTIDGDIGEAERTRMADIAERTPVTLTLKRGLPIHTELASTTPQTEARLDEALNETFPASDPPAVTP